MKPLTKRTLLCIGLIIYFGAYVAARINGELVHQHTWSNGWSRHWIVPASTDDEVRLAFIAMVLSGNLPSAEFEKSISKEVERIDMRRRILQCVFIPLVIAESAAQWTMNPRV